MNPDTPSTSPDAAPPPPVPPLPDGAGAGRPAVSAAPGADAAAIDRLLCAVRGRQRRVLQAVGASWGLASAAVLLLSGALLGPAAPALALGLLWAAPAAALVLLFVLPALSARRTVGDDLATARLLADRLPGPGHAVLSAVELQASPDSHASAALVEAFLASARARAAGVDPAQVVDGQRAVRTFRGAAGVAAACVLCAVAFHARVKAGLSAALAPRAEVAAATPVVEPVTGDVELSFEYPPWTGLAPRTVPGTNGEVTAPAGTRVTLKARADRAVQRAELSVNGVTAPLSVRDGRELAGSFMVQQSGSYRFRFLDARGKLETEGPPIAIKAEADAEPRVTILSPGDEVEVDPDGRLALRYEASDDFGLSALELVFQVSGRKEAQRLPLRRDDGRTLQDTYGWDMAPLKLRPGDRVSYYLEARDNDGAAGPKRGVSRTLSLRTYSAAEHRREALKKAEALWERLVLHLANRMEGPDRAASATAEQLREQGLVDEEGTALCGDMLATAAELVELPDAPAELSAALSNISAGLSTKVKATATTRRAVAGTAQGRTAAELDPGRRLPRTVQEEMAEAERDVLYLEALIDRGRIQDLKELAEQLAAERRELTSLVEAYKRTNDPQAREDILRRVAEMKAHINELMQRMAELARGIRDEHFNAEAMQELMKEQDLSETLDEVDQLMRDGKLDDALKKLQELSMQMEEMIAGMDEADEQVGQDVDYALAEAFQQFQDNLQQTAKQQAEVAEQTRELKDRYREKVKEQVKQRAKELKAKLLKAAEKVAADYGALGPEDLASRAQRPLEAAQAELQNLRDALAVEDFDLALEAGTRAEDAARQLEQYGEQQVAMDEVFKNPPEARAETKRTAERLHEDARAIRDINSQLEQLFPNPAQALSEPDKQKLKQLAEKQQGLKRQADQLRQQMEELGEKAPIFDPEALQQAQGIGQKMEQAAKKLEQRDAPRGHGEQRAALDQLQRLQQSLQQQGQGQKKGGLPMPLRAGGQRRGGNGRNREKVEIPDAEQFQAPREYRKDLLDAMKQGAPDRYKEQVKRYYEELVK
ncbi:MAG: DUF4175 family protein [Deltaproteobacteria bacterium]|nr:DUF4175 family protein [Deltaproteobacteria bacterium]